MAHGLPYVDVISVMLGGCFPQYMASEENGLSKTYTRGLIQILVCYSMSIRIFTVNLMFIGLYIIVIVEE